MLRRTLLALTLASVLGCGSSGTITVDRPEVFSRERLLQERSREAQFLSEKLDQAESYTMSLQGFQDVRTFTGFYNELKLKYDPLAGALGTAQIQRQVGLTEQAGALDQVNTAIALERRRRALSRLQAGEEVDVSMFSEPSPSGGTVDRSGLNPASVTAPLGVRPALPDPSGLVASKAELTKIEELNELLAYRDAIRARLVEQRLDDVHDLNGFTLYTLKFDVGVQPAAGNSKWGRVSLKIKPPGGTAACSDDCDEDACWKSEKAAAQSAAEAKASADEAKQAALDAAQGGAPPATLRSPRDSANQFYGKWLSSVQRRVTGELLSLQRRVKVLAAAEDRVEAYVAGQSLKRFLNAPSVAELSRGEHAALVDLQYQGLSLKEHYERLNSMSVKLRPEDNPEEVSPYEFLRNKLRGQDVASVSKTFGLQAEQGTVELVAVSEVLRRLARSGEDAEHTPEQVRFLAAFALVLRYHKALRSLASFDLLRLDANTYGVEVKWNKPRQEEFEKQQKAAATKDEFQPYVYAIGPKHHAQNVSAVAAQETLLNLVVSLQARLGKVGADNTSQFVRRSQNLLSAINRRTLLTSFADGHSGFGWILGPRFYLYDPWCGDIEAAYEHQPAQHSFTVTVAVPAALETFQLTGDFEWLGADFKVDESKALWGGKPITIRLPERDLDGLTGHFMERAGALATRPRIVFRNQYVVRAGQPTSILLRGEELWRNPQVFLGGQAADRVEILADMHGVRAVFGAVAAQPTTGAGPAKVDLTVVTSRGADLLPGAVTILEPKATAKTKSEIASALVRGSERIRVALSKSLLTGEPYRVALEISPKGKKNYLQLKADATISEKDSKEYELSFAQALNGTGEWAAAWGALTTTEFSARLVVTSKKGGSPAKRDLGKTFVFYPTADGPLLTVALAKGPSLEFALERFDLLAKVEPKRADALFRTPGLTVEARAMSLGKVNHTQITYGEKDVRATLRGGKVGGLWPEIATNSIKIKLRDEKSKHMLEGTIAPLSSWTRTATHLEIRFGHYALVRHVFPTHAQFFTAGGLTAVAKGKRPRLAVDVTFVPSESKEDRSDTKSMVLKISLADMAQWGAEPVEVTLEGPRQQKLPIGTHKP